MEIITPAVRDSVIGAFLVGSVAWAWSVHSMLSSMSECIKNSTSDIHEHAQKIDRHDEQIAGHSERIARVETQISTLPITTRHKPA